MHIHIHAQSADSWHKHGQRRSGCRADPVPCHRQGQTLRPNSQQQRRARPQTQAAEESVAARPQTQVAEESVAASPWRSQQQPPGLEEVWSRARATKKRQRVCWSSWQEGRRGSPGGARASPELRTRASVGDFGQLAGVAAVRVVDGQAPLKLGRPSAACMPRSLLEGSLSGSCR